MTEYMCITYLKDEAYLVDREAFYLLCRLQEVEFGFEYPFEYDREKMKMYKLTLEWLIERKKAIKLDRKPTHLIIKFRDEQY